jgi:hypothetical protein
MIAEPAEAMERDSAGQAVPRLALVELGGDEPPQRRIVEPADCVSVRWTRPTSRSAAARPFCWR